MSFDYSKIPLGHYDQVMRTGNPVRRAWHLQKFERIVECIPTRPQQSILDIGCFAGSFLSFLDEEHFPRQLGVDILSDQIDFAKKTYGTSFREFRHIESINEIQKLSEKFDCVTLIEVIEHLRQDEISVLLENISLVLKPGGSLILSTPNYFSAWPLIEILLNYFSDINYEDQHLTKFTYFNVVRKLEKIFPSLYKKFEIDIKTTTHLISPFLAFLSLEKSQQLSRLISHRTWKVPFGNLIVLKLVRK